MEADFVFHESPIEQFTTWDREDSSDRKPCVHERMKLSYFPDFLNDHQAFWDDLTDELIQEKRSGLMNYITTLNANFNASNSFSGRGVIYSSFPRILKETIVSIKFLRYYGCDLPVEIWHNNELSMHHQSMFSKLSGISFHNLAGFGEFRTGSLTKTASLLYTQLDEVLFLDSDNIPGRDPTPLFQTKAFQETGSLFWKDLWKTSALNPIWKVLDVDCVDEFEQESGQLLIKRSSFGIYRALKLSMYMQLDPFFMELVLGDKDTFKLSWRLLNIPYHLARPNMGVAGNDQCNFIMVQFAPFVSNADDSPEIAFLHMNLLKYKEYKDKPEITRLFQYQVPVAPDAIGIYKDLCTQLVDIADNKIKETAFETVLPGFAALYRELIN